MEDCGSVLQPHSEGTSDMTKSVEGSPTPSKVTSAVKHSLSGAEVAQHVSHTWEYKPAEIDPSIVNELPPEIQQEIRGWLRPQKRANRTKRGPVISDYFFPAKQL